MPFNISANNTNEFNGTGKPSAIKNVGKLILATGKTAFGFAAIFCGIALPAFALRDTKDIKALTGSIIIETEYKNFAGTPEISTGECSDINLLPYMGIGIGLASAACFVAAYQSLKSAANDIQEVFS
jgi:hypothetical protein